MIYIGETKFVFGVPTLQLPLKIEGEFDRVKMRFRPKEFGTAFVKSGDRVSRYYIEQHGIEYKLGMECGRNVTRSKN